MKKECYRPRLGASLSYADKSFKEKTARARELAFDTLDFDLCAFWDEPEKQQAEYTRDNIEGRLETLLSSGVGLNCIHISFGEQWDVSVDNAFDRESNLKRVADVIKRTRDYKPFGYVFHASKGIITDEERQTRIANAEASVLKLAELSEARFCVETLPRCALLNTSREALAVIKYLHDRNDKIMLCADVNHFLQEKSEDALAALIDYVATTHISDHDYADERHWMPGKGRIDWMKLIEVLKNANYGGVFNYELEASFDEIRANYDELFGKFDKYEADKTKTVR